MQDQTVEIEAAAFRQLLAHLQEHTEVQNIDLMILADFCRNCLAKWYSAAALERGNDVDYEQAREIVYGMPYREWKKKYQGDATPEQMAAFEAKQKIKSPVTTADNAFDAMFSGIIGQDYQMLKLICPAATEMSRLVGLEVGEYCKDKADSQMVLELGGGTGITTLSLLTSDDRLRILSVDNAQIMQDQAKENLHAWVERGRLTFSADDALTALNKMDTCAVDLVASAYTLHNFEAGYRWQVIQEIERVLKPGGLFVSGDRYALDDISAHTQNTQREVAGYFKVLTEINRLDLLEHWIIHLFNDESENHIMRESIALQQLSDAGFSEINLKVRNDVNALVVAKK